MATFGTVKKTSTVCILVAVIIKVFVIEIASGDSEKAAVRPKIQQLNPCTCQFDHKIVDLQPLGFKNNTPRFQDIRSYRFDYSYNPCYDFDEGDCHGVAGCQHYAGRLYYDLGSQSSATFLWSEEGLLQIQYRAESSGSIRRTLYVTLVCTNMGDERFVVNGERETERAVYDMTLYHYLACPVDIPKPAHLSTGSIMCIAFFLLAMVYMAVGVLVQVFLRKASGVYVIPHVTFWAALPGLIKDGAMFVVKRGKTDAMYQTM